MGTAKFDDGTPSNQKIVAAGPIASWLWFCGVLYCRRALTDGFIPKVVVPTLVIGLSNPYKHATRLVEVGLWHDAIGGYQVHDYLDWNPAKATVETYRKNDRIRKQARHGFRADSDSDSTLESRSDSGRIPNDNAVTRGTHARVESESESESERFSAERVSEESARETTPMSVEPPSWKVSAYRPSLASGAAYHQRNCPPWGASACESGLCIPKYLWPQWERRSGGTEAWLASLRLFVEGVMQRTPPAAGDKAETFWPAHFERHFGTTAPPPTTGKKTAVQTTLDTMRRSLGGARG